MRKSFLVEETTSFLDSTRVEMRKSLLGRNELFPRCYYRFGVPDCSHEDPCRPNLHASP
jgi:hypothetical protein